MKRIIFGGGCFWGVEAYFKHLKGIIKTSVGYTNGNIPNPTYQDLLNRVATHVEACEIYYDEFIISLPKLLEHLFRIIEPTSLNRQGADIGIQYRTGIYYQNEEDKLIIDQFMANEQVKFQEKIMVEVIKEDGYVLAEEYHQDYLTKNPLGYCHVNLNFIKPSERKETKN